MVTFEGERRQKHDLSFNENEIKLGKLVMDQARTTLEFFYYLMNKKRNGKLTTTIILLSADNIKLESLLPKWKRQTDILLEIDKEKKLYLILCQSTDRKGGEQFGEILLSNINIHGGHSTYCVETEVMNTSYAIQEVVFTMVEKYLDIKRKEEYDKVFFTEVGEINYTVN